MFEIRTLLILIPALPLAGDDPHRLSRTTGAEDAEPPAHGVGLGRFLALQRCLGGLAADGLRRANGGRSRIGGSFVDLGRRLGRLRRRATPPYAATVWDRCHAAGRRSDRRDAGDGDVRLAAGGHLLVGYMHGDRGYWRFFTYISLFVFSMTMLVSVSNFVLLYVFWEGGGAVQLPVDRLLVREAGGGGGGQEGVSGQSRGRFRLCPGDVPDLDDLRHAQLPRHDGAGSTGRGRTGPDAAERCRSRSSAAGWRRRSACC